MAYLICMSFLPTNLSHKLVRLSFTCSLFVF